jgi:hypothetical protein
MCMYTLKISAFAQSQEGLQKLCDKLLEDKSQVSETYSSNSITVHAKSTTPACDL